MNDVMLDIETLGQGSFAAIISIGAVRFDVANGAIGDKFYSRVCPQSSVDAGMHIDTSTVLWWFKQGDAARAEFNVPNPPKLKDVLLAFTGWMNRTPGEKRVWGNGATFDNVIVTNAYKLLGLERPWSYKGDRCYRTVRALFPDVKMVDVGIAHRADHDAEAQARHLMAIWPKIRG